MKQKQLSLFAYCFGLQMRLALLDMLNMPVLEAAIALAMLDHLLLDVA